MIEQPVEVYVCIYYLQHVYLNTRHISAYYILWLDYSNNKNDTHIARYVQCANVYLIIITNKKYEYIVIYSRPEIILNYFSD